MESLKALKRALEFCLARASVREVKAAFKVTVVIWAMSWKRSWGPYCVIPVESAAFQWQLRPRRSRALMNNG